ncbi:hypothetical protein KGF57_003791 [Candida theae]|uniref:Uncharacterized protein n=1 Tax=Candida theae TaxID=1198502 RepID=A0AAD5BCT2_9ASCO|nr:uncharacterized protein KGF57_003791 [Candida theae]KAI5954768.1 hypothetical protein KGF57_003791 [Candida theae]
MKKLINSSKEGRRDSMDDASAREQRQSQPPSKTDHINPPANQSERHHAINAPSSSSSMLTFDDVYSPNRQKAMSTSTSDSKLTPELTSPTKSLKTFLFKNRLSSYSIDSISEAPELESQVTQEQQSLASQPGATTVHDLTPTKSPNRLLNFGLRPKFIRSKSSGLSDANPPPTPSRLSTSNRKRVTLDDFADTDSDDSAASPNHETSVGDPENVNLPILFDDTFDESVNSVLQEYHNRDSDARTRSMFLESDLRPKSGELSLQESEQLKSDIIRQGSIKSIGAKTTQEGEHTSSDNSLFIDAKASQEQFRQGNVKVSQASPTIFNRISVLSDESSPKTPRSDRDSTGSSTSLRFKVHGNQIEPVKNKARHVSSATNISQTETNRSSLRASVALSDDSETNDSGRASFPDPTVTPLATPRVNYRDSKHSSSSNRSSINDSAIAGSLPNTSSSGGGGGGGNVGGRSHLIQPSVPPRHSLADDSISLDGDEYHLDEETINSKTKVSNVTNSYVFDETMLKSDDTKHSSMARSSMSSGELLRNLVGSSYDQTRSSDNSDQRPRSQYREGGAASRPVSTMFNVSKPIATVPEMPIDTTSENIYPHLPSKQRLPRIGSSQTVNDMTAGLDATNELPIMLYTIHNKDYDESKNRWSVYENRNSQNTQNAAREPETGGLSTHSESRTNSPDPNEVLASRSQKSHAGSLSGSSGVGTRSTARVSNASSSLSRHKQLEGRQLDNHRDVYSDTPQPHNLQGHRQDDPHLPGQQLVLSQPKRDLFLSDRQPSSNMIDEEKQIDSYTYNPSRGATNFPRQEKQEGEYESTYKFLPYTWLQFSLLMLVGLVAPPIYFLTTVGVFDGKDGHGSYYGGMTGYEVNHSNRGVYVKRFTKSQKIVSFVLGLAWVLIVLAMIGVGLGVGLTRGS